MILIEIFSTHMHNIYYKNRRIWLNIFKNIEKNMTSLIIWHQVYRFCSFFYPVGSCAVLGIGGSYSSHSSWRFRSNSVTLGATGTNVALNKPTVYAGIYSAMF